MDKIVKNMPKVMLLAFVMLIIGYGINGIYEDKETKKITENNNSYDKEMEKEEKEYYARLKSQAIVSNPVNISKKEMQEVNERVEKDKEKYQLKLNKEIKENEKMNKKYMKELLQTVKTNEQIRKTKETDRQEKIKKMQEQEKNMQNLVCDSGVCYEE